MNDSLLLHVCCAECLVKALTSFNEEAAEPQFDNDGITLYFDNSNIHPRTEWVARLEAVKSMADEYGSALIVADWSPKKWYEAIEYNADNSELRRCTRCWKLRLTNTAQKAQELGIANISSTLLSSMFQNRKVIERIGTSFEKEDLDFLTFTPDHKEDLTIPFYRQNYCGCCYSLVERYEEKHCR